MTGGKAEDDAAWEQIHRVNDERDYVHEVIAAYQASTEFRADTYSEMDNIALEALRWKNETVRL